MKPKTFHLIPVDLAVFGYMLITALYMVTGSDKLQGVSGHLLTRVFITGAILIFAMLDNKKDKTNKVYYFVRNFYPLLLLGYFYKETGYMNNIIFDFFDPWFAKTEQMLWGMQPSIEFSKLMPQKWFSELMNFGYFFYYLLTLGLALAFFLWKKNKLQEAIFIIFTSFAIYYLFFALVPVKGPQFYFTGTDAQTVDSYFFSKLVKFAQSMGETATGAFPSSHVGMSLIFLILSWKYIRKSFWIILIPVILLWFATVYIKAHYLIDVIGGFLSAPLVYLSSVWLYRYLTSIRGDSGKE